MPQETRKYFHAYAPAKLTGICSVCGKGMYCNQPNGRHFMCDPNAIEGRICTCPRECSDTAVGNGPRPCDPACVPCREQKGMSLVKRGKS